MKKGKDIYTRILEYIKEKELIVKGERILLSLSAGKDSMAMLDFFLNLRHVLAIELGVFHFNHMMRGKESDDDEKFVSDNAVDNKLELFVNKFDFKDNMSRGYSFEEYARSKRYGLLDKTAAEHKFDKIATAHNRDDNIETILMRILSGTGIHGLQGIASRRDNIIRPLLFLSAREIYGHLTEKKIPWREDSSNKENKYLRNFVRNSLLPEINERFKGAGNSILSVSDIAEEYTLLINELLTDKKELYIFEKNQAIIETDRYINNKKLFKYIISKAIRENFNEFVTSGMLEEIYKTAINGKSHARLYKKEEFLIRKTLKNNKKVIVISRSIEYNKIVWEYSLNLYTIESKSIYIKEIGESIFFKYVDYEYFLKRKGKNNIIFVAFPCDIKNACIRNRRNGDRIKLEHGLKKIKELMIDNKLDEQMKESIPLFMIDSFVAAFMPGFVNLIPNRPIQNRPVWNRVSVDFHVKSDSEKILAIYNEEYQL